MMIFAETTTECTVIDIICEFLEIAIHNILYLEKVYPETIFECRHKYGVTVYQSVHTAVNDYILNCLSSIRFYLTKNQIQGIFICFQSGQSVRRYCFEIGQITDCLESSSDQFLLKLEQHFRNFCLKLHSVSSNSITTDDNTFSIELLVTQHANLEFSQDPTHENFLWIDVADTKNKNSTIIPLQNCETDFISMQTYIKQEA